MVGWIVFYILAIPIFSFMLPIYSFWRMDDFSWGVTRVVLGKSGQKMIIHVRWARAVCWIDANVATRKDEGKFDPQ